MDLISIPLWSGAALVAFGPVTVAGIAATRRGWDRIQARSWRHGGDQPARLVGPPSAWLAYWGGVMLTLAGLWMLGLGVAGALYAWRVSVDAVIVLLSGA